MRFGSGALSGGGWGAMPSMAGGGQRSVRPGGENKRRPGIFLSFEEFIPWPAGPWWRLGGARPGGTRGPPHRVPLMPRGAGEGAA